VLLDFRLFQKASSRPAPSGEDDDRHGGDQQDQGEHSVHEGASWDIGGRVASAWTPAFASVAVFLDAGLI
jgi:hypothetical protein